MATVKGMFPSHSTDALQKLLIEYDFDVNRVAEAVGSGEKKMTGIYPGAVPFV
jgi:hypothetical protein